MENRNLIREAIIDRLLAKEQITLDEAKLLIPVRYMTKRDIVMDFIFFLVTSTVLFSVALFIVSMSCSISYAVYKKCDIQQVLKER